MNLSSVLVYSNPTYLDTVMEALALLPGVEVYHHCRATGRVVLIQEQVDSEQQINGLQDIKSVAHVMAAEMVYHYVEDGHGADIALAQHVSQEAKQ